jgi:hypothetical protein
MNGNIPSRKCTRVHKVIIHQENQVDQNWVVISSRKCTRVHRTTTMNQIEEMVEEKEETDATCLLATAN